MRRPSSPRSARDAGRAAEAARRGSSGSVDNRRVTEPASTTDARAQAGAPPPLSSLTLAETVALLVSLGEPRYRGEQVFRSVWREGKLDPASMTTLAKTLRTRLSATVGPAATSVVEAQESKDGTTKLLLGLADGARIETVIIPEGERRTV